MDAARCRTAMAASLPLVRARFEAGVCATGAGAPAALGRGQVRPDEAQFFDAMAVKCVSAWEPTLRHDASQRLGGPLSHLPEKTCKIAPIAPIASFIGAVWAVSAVLAPRCSSSNNVLGPEIDSQTASSRLELEVVSRIPVCQRRVDARAAQHPCAESRHR